MELASININDYWMLVLVIVAWEFAWKGVAMWKAAQNNDKPWFAILLVVNSIGILPILYIYFIGKKTKSHKAA